MTQQTKDSAVARTSRVGKLPVAIPKGVTVTESNGVVTVKGGKGELQWSLPTGTSIAVDGDKLAVACAAGRDSARAQGLARALIANMVKGTSEGFSKHLIFVGTGYRAELKDDELHLSVGLSHPVVFRIPPGIEISIPKDSKGGTVVVSGADRARVGQTAARIRGTRPAEPYGGKGIRYRGEQVREKAGKSGKGAKGAR